MPLLLPIGATAAVCSSDVPHTALGERARQAVHDGDGAGRQWCRAGEADR